MLVNAARDVFDVVAHHQRRDAGRDLDILDAPPQLALRLGQRLAALLRGQACNLVEVFIQQPLELEEVLDALGGRRAAPFSKGCLGRTGRLVHLFRGREWHTHQRLGGRGVAHVQKFTGV